MINSPVFKRAIYILLSVCSFALPAVILGLSQKVFDFKDELIYFVSISFGALTSVWLVAYDFAGAEQRRHEDFTRNLDQSKREILESSLVVLEAHKDRERTIGRLSEIADLLLAIRGSEELKAIRDIADKTIADALVDLRELATNRQIYLQRDTISDILMHRWANALVSMMGTRGTLITISNMFVWSQKCLGIYDGSSYLSSTLQKCKQDNEFFLKRVIVVPPLDRHFAEIYGKTFSASLQLYLKEVETALSDETRERFQTWIYICSNHKEFADHFSSQVDLNGFSSNFAMWSSVEKGKGKGVATVVAYKALFPDFDDKSTSWQIEKIAFVADNKRLEKLEVRFSKLYSRKHDLQTIQSYLTAVQALLASTNIP